MDVFAHRGVPYVAPENTLISFTIARSLGAGLEMDVRISRDGVPVCMHDATLERTTNGTGLVRSYSIDELRRMDAGGWFGDQFGREGIPVLEEILGILNDVPIAVEVKCPGSEALIVDVLERTNSLSHVYLTDSPNAVNSAARIKQLNPSARTAVCCLCRQDYLGLKRGGLDAVDAIWAWVYSGWLTNEQVDEIHQDGLKVFATTLNRQEDFIRYIEHGVDGICTDHPADMLSAMEVNTEAAQVEVP